MTDHTYFASILERLLCSLVANPREVEVTASPLVGRMNWAFTCSLDNIGQIVGKRGVRLRALRLIVEIAGRNQAEQWFLSQPHNLQGTRSDSNRNPVDIPEHHNTQDDFDLLRDLLMALNVNVTLAVSGDVNAGFRFDLVPALIGDNVALLEPHEAVWGENQSEKQPLNLISALGCVFRAIGARQGVRYQIQTRD